MNSECFSKHLDVVKNNKDRHEEQELIFTFTAYSDEVHQEIFTGGKSLYAQIGQTQDEPQWIVAQRLLSTLPIPGFN